MCKDLTVNELHEIVGGRLRLATLPPPAGEQTPIGRVVIDSRQVQPGDTFWGLVGKQRNGGSFAEDAYDRRACGRRGGRPLRATRAGMLEPGSRRRGRFALEAGGLESQPVRRPGHRGDRQCRQNDHAADDPRRVGPLAGRIGQPAQLQQSSRRAVEPVGHFARRRLHGVWSWRPAPRRDRHLGRPGPARDRGHHPAGRSASGGLRQPRITGPKQARAVGTFARRRLGRAVGRRRAAASGSRLPSGQHRVGRPFARLRPGGHRGSRTRRRAVVQGRRLAFRSAGLGSTSPDQCLGRHRGRQNFWFAASRHRRRAGRLRAAAAALRGVPRRPDDDHQRHLQRQPHRHASGLGAAPQFRSPRPADRRLRRHARAGRSNRKNSTAAWATKSSRCAGPTCWWSADSTLTKSPPALARPACRPAG